MPGHVAFEVSRRGAESGRLGEALRAHFKYERVSLARVVLVHLLAPVGLLPWIAAGWPAALPRRVVAGGLALWAVVFVGVVVASALEYKWYQREARCLEESGGSREDSG